MKNVPYGAILWTLFLVLFGFPLAFFAVAVLGSLYGIGVATGLINKEIKEEWKESK